MTTISRNGSRYRDYAEPVCDTLTFKIDTTYMFTHVESDLSGTDLAGIMESSEPLESGLAGNKAYVSGVLGIYTRIGFPYQGRYPPVYKHFPVNVLLTAGKGVWKSEKYDQDQNVQQWFD